MIYHPDAREEGFYWVVGRKVARVLRPAAPPPSYPRPLNQGCPKIRGALPAMRHKTQDTSFMRNEYWPAMTDVVTHGRAIGMDRTIGQPSLGQARLRRPG